MQPQVGRFRGLVGSGVAKVNTFVSSLICSIFFSGTDAQSSLNWQFPAGTTEKVCSMMRRFQCGKLVSSTLTRRKMLNKTLSYRSDNLQVCQRCRHGASSTYLLRFVHNDELVPVEINRFHD